MPGQYNMQPNLTKHIVCSMICSMITKVQRNSSNEAAQKEAVQRWELKKSLKGVSTKEAAQNEAA
jgi:hypothetical protein